ncbi:uncharacterized protein SAPINGB_P005990 [Magnusiomyces paraingens]|uniref:TauD/TfdA-like domain-containing protein n=1 Tax=Magnusiomyces paraingens TaxID=2606893 RepID=A0A5E8C9U8_9ASCO|nr:uncharacterized protein SAPINGB_P005990 [Saprochaete ingens]VVT58006.1 unnamed protein product [Saprochaete ingens]
MSALDKLEFSVFNDNKFPKSKEIKGPSPYWDKKTEGPSYIKPEDRQKPLVSSGKLDKGYSTEEVELTPLLGSTYNVNVRLVDLLKDDDLIRDLAIKISQRGVVVFKKQDDLTVEQQKELVQKLGILSGKPKENGLHIHPLAPSGGVVGENGLVDPEISFISSRFGNEYAKEQRDYPTAYNWHSDITFEPVPADYSSLRLVELPPTGGDTFWANGYALYEKLSPSLRAYFETLTGTYSQPRFNEFGKKKNFELYSDKRGAAENVGDELISTHPVVRTNPVTGWKSLFAIGNHFTKFNEVTPLESNLLKEYLWNTLAQSHDIQVRHKWDKYDIAIWDNRSTYHAINKDVLFYDDDLVRSGIRTVGIAERPYLDPNSTTQTEALKEKKSEEK